MTEMLLLLSSLFAVAMICLGFGVFAKILVTLLAIVVMCAVLHFAVIFLPFIMIATLIALAIAYQKKDSK
jgi:hypothetical protein